MDASHIDTALKLRPGILAKRDGPVNPPEMKKVPFEIAKLALEMQEKGFTDTQPVDLSFWDFAGQGIFYSTHQIFLFSRGIYIVVLDLKKGLKHTLKANRKDRLGCDVADIAHEQTVEAFLTYWMACIYSTVKEEDRSRDKRRPKRPAIVIVCTHKDVYKGDIGEYINTVKRFLGGKDYNKHRYPEIFAVSTLSPESPEIVRLREALLSLAEDETYDVPLVWFNLKEYIQKNPKNFLTWKELENAAREVNLQHDNIEPALAFFHAVGDLVFFDDMRDCIVTNPQWLVNQFTKVISTENKDDKHSKYWAELDEYGYLRGSLLEKIWPLDSERKQMTKLMTRFALLLPVKNYLTKEQKVQLPKKGEEVFLVPCLSPPPKPQSLGPQKPLTLKPVCNFIPSGLTGRLISQLSTQEDWAICGQVDARNATFELQDGCQISLHVKTSPQEIEIRGKCSKNTTLKSPLNVISRRIAALPGTVEFEMCLQCCHRPEKSRMGTLAGVDLIVKENPRICTEHDCKKLLDTEYASWFTDPRTSTGTCTEHDGKQIDMDHLSKSFKRKLGVFSKRLLVDAGLLMGLYSYDVIARDAMEMLESKPTNSEKIYFLMTDILPKRSNDHNQLFLKCLLETEQGHILEEMGMSTQQIDDIRSIADP